MQVQFTYEKFLHAIKEQQDKFRNISNKKVGEPFSEGLFSAFFALHVIPLRASLFPNIHAKLEEKRRKRKAIERYAKINAELEAAEKERQEREKKMKPVVNALMTYAVAKSLAKQSKQVGNKPKGKK